MIELTGKDLHIILNKLIPVVQLANEAVMKIYVQDFGVDYKADKSPLTLADNTSNKIICDNLATITPQIPIISEENREIPYSDRSQFTYCWIVDPLDGTKEFVKKNDEFAINVALCHHNSIILAVVGTPIEDGIVWAIKGHGAFYQKGKGAICRLSCGEYRPTDQGIRVITSRSHLSQETKAHINKYQEAQILPKGSSWKFIMIANNEADYYPRLGPTMEWDTAAPQLILEEAGGSIIDLDTHQPLQYNKPNLLNPNFIAKGIEC